MPQVVDTITIGRTDYNIVARRYERADDGTGYALEHPRGGNEVVPSGIDDVYKTTDDVTKAVQRYIKEEVHAGETDRIDTGKDSAERLRTLSNGWEVWTYLNGVGDRRWYIITSDSMYVDVTGEKQSKFVPLEVKDSVRRAIESANIGSSGIESRENLRYGWVLVETKEGKFYVVGTRDGSTVYLDADGEEASEKKSFSDIKKARRAFRRWVQSNTARRQDRRREQTREATVQVSTASGGGSSSSPPPSARSAGEIPTTALVAGAVVLVGALVLR